MKKTFLMLAACLAAGCSTTITTPNGWKYTNRGFNKTMAALSLEQTSSNRFKLAVEGWKSDNQQMAEAFAQFLVSMGPLISRGANYPLPAGSPTMGPIQEPLPAAYVFTNNMLIPLNR